MKDWDLEAIGIASFIFVVTFAGLAGIVGGLLYGVFELGQIHCATTTIIRGASTTITKVCK